MKVLYLLNKLDIINSTSHLLFTSTKSEIAGLDGVKYVTDVRVHRHLSETEGRIFPLALCGLWASETAAQESTINIDMVGFVQK